ncbi:MAG: hypothetical protein ABSG25_05690 [Bryobacteraceae bacterium]
MDVAAQLEKLASAGIRYLPLPGLPHYFVFERDGFAALVEGTQDGFGGIGNAGLLTESGLAVLVWRGDRAYFRRKDFEQSASESQVAALRRFAEDLKRALC